jgi:hypothetical protein
MNWQCLFGHGHTVNGRTASGQLTRVCERCHQSLGVVLEGDVLAGPAKDQAPVAGQPNTKVTKLWPANVTDIRESRR